MKPYLNSRFFIFNVNRYNTFDQFIDDTYENISIEDREKIRQKMVKILYLLMPRYDACKNIFRGLDDSITGVVSNYMVEECIPEETSDGKIIAKRDENNKLKTAYWYERSRSEEITEETGEVFHIVNKKKYKIKTTHFKTNLFCQRSIESAVSDKSGVYSYFYEKNKKFDDHMAEEVQRNNVNKAIELAAEIGIEYRHGKFTNFPKINFLCLGSGKHLYRIQYYLKLFGINMDISFVDSISGFAYYEIGLYETAEIGWVADFPDPATWISIFSSGHNMNFFFTGNIEG